VASDHLFSTAWLKWGRAIIHAEALKADIDSFRGDADANPVLAYRAEYHAKRHGFSIVPAVVNMMPARWGLILGDIVSNYRAAIDHLAWAIVRRGHRPPSTLTDRQQRRVCFPIYDSRTAFNNAVSVARAGDTNLPGAGRSDIAKIRAQQPYHYGTEGQRFESSRARHELPANRQFQSVEGTIQK
jgi:hypothetical protein